MTALFTSLAALMYAAGSLFTKRSMAEGANRRRVIAVTNIAMALWALPLFFLSGGSFDLGSWLIAIAAGVTLFAGRILSVNALQIGDLSLVGPLLGIKTLLVGLFSFLTGQIEMTPQLWIAVTFASLAVILLQRSPAPHKKKSRRAVLYAAGASILFAMTDILVVEAGGSLGIGWLSPTVFMTLALLVPLLGKLPPEPPSAKKPLCLGAVIMGFQTFFVVLLIGITGNAVLINIVYSTRALWTVLVDRYAGGGKEVVEHFYARIVGALLIVVSVGIVLIEQ